MKEMIIFPSSPSVNYILSFMKTSEYVAQRCSVEKVFLEIRKIHRKSPVPESLFNEVADHRTETWLKKRLWHRYFPVNFAKFLRKPFLTERLLWLLRKLVRLWRRVFRRKAKFIIFMLISFIFYSLKCFLVFYSTQYPQKRNYFYSVCL